MSKIEQVFHGYRLTVDKIVDNEGIPDAELYRISVFGEGNHWREEITLTEGQMSELKRFLAENASGIIAKPFGTDEIDNEFRPRFGGANPKYREFYYAGWNAAFEYVNYKILKSEV